MTQKKLQKQSIYAEYDEDGDGIVSDEELSHVAEIKKLEHDLRKQRAQRRMATASLIAMGAFTVAMFFVDIERVKALAKVEPLGLPLELMSGYDGVELYIAESSKARKATSIFQDMLGDIELKVSSGVVAIACRPKDGAAVQIGLAELGAKPVQIPAGEGSPAKMMQEAEQGIKASEEKITSCEQSISEWAKKHGDSLVVLLEYLEREEAIFTAPTLLAVSNQAFVVDGWVPTNEKAAVEAALKESASHISIEPYEAPHHDHHHDHHHAQHDNLPDVGGHLEALERLEEASEWLHAVILLPRGHL